MLLEFGLYLVTGMIAGFFAGLFGIGGGLIIVPVLTTVFVLFLDGEHLVHLAIGTSMATILITSLASVKTHQKASAVRWDLFKTLTPGVVIGGLLGSLIAHLISANFLAKLFAIIEMAIAFKLLLNMQPSPQRTLSGWIGQSSAGTVIGCLSTLVGIGGGTLTTPYLIWHNVSIRHAIATSSAVSLPIASAGTLGFMISGWQVTQLPNYTTGYLYWPAFIGITLASFFTAPMGARLTHQLPANTLRKAFAILLFILAIKMFWF
ncbi:hypothetical protein CYQ88_04690 [Hydrogenovibrio sp. SC-1]|uniref:sulfite exporter TauE/SafE family protein n=1 Tax=Hydrogenovibrio sp. SC-1 TaxID=2065820 RepID=UPI000C7D39A3|nr:sulfite exporter TauE/SafE family protein [Hydrogenovibrio sp. SC-1]PLA74612.1 hypothetical protein CYQ88_04690 [Hydrogenovibrio sp. SC-1]